MVKHSPGWLMTRIICFTRLFITLYASVLESRTSSEA